MTTTTAEYLPPIELIRPYEFDSGMTFMTATVNAELAARLLRAFNVEPETGQVGTNRRHSDKVVTRYAEAILNGEWFLSCQTVGFSEANDNGNFELLDGQHRLMAVILANETRPGIAVPLSFCLNVPLKTKAVLDTGAARRPAHHLQMSGVKHAAAVAAAAKLMYVVKSVKYNGGGSWETARWSVGLMSNTLLAHPHLRQGMEEHHRIRVRLAPYISSVIWTLVAEEWDPYTATEFLQGFAREVKPTEFTPTDPRWMARMMFENARDAHRKFKGFETLAILVKTFNAWKTLDQEFKPYFRSNEKRYPGVLTREKVEELLALREQHLFGVQE